MIKITLDEFYLRHAGYVEAVAGYCEDRRLPMILKGCRMRPETSLHKPLSVTPILDKWWFDDFGHSLKLRRYDNIHVTYNDLRLPRNKIVRTDLFAKSSIKDLFTISKLLYIVSGTEPTTGEPVYILTFLGKDNYFRTRVFSHQIWDTEISSLYLGLNILKFITENHAIRYYLDVDNIQGRLPSYPVANVRQWITHLPAHPRFVSMLRSEVQGLVETIGLKSSNFLKGE